MSLYQHILKHSPKDRPGLPPEGLALPGVVPEAKASPFAPGARDHLALYEGKMLGAPDAAALAGIEAAARAAGAEREPTDESIATLEQALDREDALALVDDALDRVGGLGLEDWEPVYDALSAVALNTDRPQALKLAMALLGPFQEEETIPFYKTLSRHPEFSLFATTALANDARPAARAALVTLLDETKGWAKVDVVERLLRVEDLDVSEVLLTKSMENADPVAGYIALGVAERCDLAGALEARGLTRDTLSGACGILGQLARDALEKRAAGVGSLDDYEDAGRAIAAFRERLPGGPADLDMAEAAEALRAWARARTGRKHLEALIEDTSVYLERADVVGAIIADLLHRDPARRAQAARLAGRARIEDSLTTLLEVLQRHPEEDAIGIAAVRLAAGAELIRLRDRLAERVKPGARAGVKSAQHALDAGARWIWQWTALLEELPRIPDAVSRGFLREATRDRDPAIRQAAFGALRAIGSEDPEDIAAMAAAKDDPSEEIARETPRVAMPAKARVPSSKKKPAPKKPKKR